jgi:quercetin dioxygenase-like cupin family protein
MTTHTYISDLAAYSEIPADGILSRTVINDAFTKVVYFGFAAGEELSEHTASMPALLHIIQGEVRLTLGDETYDAGPNTWVHMPANLTHSVFANTPTTLLLTLLKRGQE